MKIPVDLVGRTVQYLLRTSLWPLAFPVLLFACFGALWVARRAGYEWALGGSLQSTSVLLTGLLLVVSCPLAAYLRTRKRGRTTAAIVAGFLGLLAGLGCAAGVLRVGSTSFEKPIDMAETIPASRITCEALGEGELLIRETAATVIKLVRERACGEDGSGDIHIVVQFEWRMMRFLPGFNPNRMYGGRFRLLGNMRRTSDGGFSTDPLKLKDYSVWPIQGWWAHLMGWSDAPSIGEQASLITGWMDERLRAVENPYFPCGQGQSRVGVRPAPERLSLGTSEDKPWLSPKE